MYHISLHLCSCKKKDYFKLQTKIDTYLPKIFSLSNKNLKQYKW